MQHTVAFLKYIWYGIGRYGTVLKYTVHRWKMLYVVWNIFTYSIFMARSCALEVTVQVVNGQGSIGTYGRIFERCRTVLCVLEDTVQYWKMRYTITSEIWQCWNIPGAVQCWSKIRHTVQC